MEVSLIPFGGIFIFPFLFIFKQIGHQQIKNKQGIRNKQGIKLCGLKIKCNPGIGFTWVLFPGSPLLHPDID